MSYRSGAPADVLRVHEMLTPKPKELITNCTYRRFIRDGEIDVYNSTERRMKHRYFFLFNDVLLLTKKEGSRRFWLKVYISLRTSLRVEDVPDTASPYRDEFRLYAPKKTFIFFARSEEGKLGWLRDIKAAINGEYGIRDGAPYNAGGSGGGAGSYAPSGGESAASIMSSHSSAAGFYDPYPQTASKAPPKPDPIKLSGAIGRIDISGASDAHRSGNVVGDDVEEDVVIASIGAPAVAGSSGRPRAPSGGGGNIIGVTTTTTTTTTSSTAPPKYKLDDEGDDPFAKLAQRNTGMPAPVSSAPPVGLQMPHKPLPPPPSFFDGGAAAAPLQPTPSAPLQPTPLQPKPLQPATAQPSSHDPSGRNYSVLKEAMAAPTSSPSYGASASGTGLAAGGFGASVLPPSYGSASGYGAPATGLGGYGATTTPATGLGGYGATTTPATGLSGFGTTTPATGLGGYGTTTTPATGLSGFGTTTPATGLGGYGATTTPATGLGGYGATTTPATGLSGFGTTTPATGLGGYGTTTPATGLGGYGGTTTPATGLSGFGTTTPATGLGGYGATTTPATGLSGFGTTTAAPGSTLSGLSGFGGLPTGSNYVPGMYSAMAGIGAPAAAPAAGGGMYMGGMPAGYSMQPQQPQQYQQPGHGTMGTWPNA